MGPAEGLDGLVDGGTWPQAVRFSQDSSLIFGGTINDQHLKK